MNMLTAKKCFGRIGWALLAVLALTVGLQLLLGLLSGLLFEGDVPSWFLWLLTFLPLYFVAIPIAALILATLPTQPAVGRKLGVIGFLKALAICFPIMYAGNIIGTLLSALLSGNQAANPVVEITQDESLLRLLVIPLLAPCLEALLFRKLLIDRCVRFGEKTAVLFSAFCFGLFHMNLFQFFYAFGIGLVFGYLYVRTRRLRYSVLLHCILNFQGGVLGPWLVEKAGLLSLAEDNPAALLESLSPWVLAFGVYFFRLAAYSLTGFVLLILSLDKLVFLPAEAELARGQRFRTVCLNPGFLLFAAACLVMIALSLLGW